MLQVMGVVTPCMSLQRQWHVLVCADKETLQYYPVFILYVLFELTLLLLSFVIYVHALDPGDKRET